MAIKPGLKGVSGVLRNINNKVDAMQKSTMKGLIKAAIVVRRDMDATSPLIPVGKTGNLRASYFTFPKPSKLKPVLVLGFTAEYAWYVHEMIGASFKRPGAGAKFLEAALNRNKQAILKAIRDEVRK